MNLNLNKSNWVKVKFGDIVEKIKNKIDPNGYYVDNVVEGGNIGKRDFRVRKYENKKELGYLGPAFNMGFKAKQILYVSRNPHLMKVGYPNFDGICANTTFIMQSKNESDFRNDLIPFLMHSDTFVEQSVTNVRGGVNPYVNWGDLASIELKIPPKDQQDKLAKLLWAIDDLIESHINLEKNLKKTRNSLFKKLINKANGKTVLLSEVLIPKKEKSKYPHQEQKYIGLENIKPGEFEVSTFSSSENIKSVSNIIKKGDLCYSKLRPYLDKAFIASFDAISTTELLIYDSKYVSKEYLLYYLHSQDFLNYISEKGYGTKMPRVDNDIIGSFPILVPDEESIILEDLKKCSIPIDDNANKILISKELKLNLINQIF